MKITHLSKACRKRAIAYLIYMHVIEDLSTPEPLPFRLPSPIKFSLVATFFSFLIISQMPLIPLAIPIAFGGGLSFALITIRI